jgi:hypothetical protein
MLTSTTCLPELEVCLRQVLTLLCSLIEWPLDKLKFVRLSSPNIRGRFHNSAALLSALMFMCAVAGLLHYPTGPLWYRPPCQRKQCCTAAPRISHELGNNHVMQRAEEMLELRVALNALWLKISSKPSRLLRHASSSSSIFTHFNGAATCSRN